MTQCPWAPAPPRYGEGSYMVYIVFIVYMVCSVYIVYAL